MLIYSAFLQHFGTETYQPLALLLNVIMPSIRLMVVVIDVVIVTAFRLYFFLFPFPFISDSFIHSCHRSCVFYIFRFHSKRSISTLNMLGTISESSPCGFSYATNDTHLHSSNTNTNTLRTMMSRYQIVE